MYKILIVPHYLLEVELGSSFLDRRSFKIRTATTADQALSTAEIWQPTMVVFSNNFDGMKIYKFCQRLRKCQKKIKLLMLSDKIAESMSEVVKANTDAHLVSPVNKKQLLETIASLLDVQQRSTAAYRLQILVQLEGVDQKKPSKELANITVLNGMGLTLVSENTISVGSKGKALFVLPGTKTRLALQYTVKAVIDEVRLHYALEFVNLAASDATAIHEFIEKHNMREGR